MVSTGRAAQRVLSQTLRRIRDRNPRQLTHKLFTKGKNTLKNLITARDGNVTLKQAIIDKLTDPYEFFQLEEHRKNRQQGKYTIRVPYLSVNMKPFLMDQAKHHRLSHLIVHGQPGALKRAINTATAAEFERHMASRQRRTPNQQKKMAAVQGMRNAHASYRFASHASSVPSAKALQHLFLQQLSLYEDPSAKRRSSLWRLRSTNTNRKPVRKTQSAKAALQSAMIRAHARNSRMSHGSTSRSQTRSKRYARSV